MKPRRWKAKCALVFVIGGMLAANPVIADKPPWAGHGKGPAEADRHDEAPSRQHTNDSSHSSQHFTDQHRVILHEYYSDEFRSGHCPPGLAKKHNGCMPPGQAKKWQIGRPLPANVVYYEVPQSLVVQIGLPPSGYRYVRVASDVLMIAAGTGMIVDAIQDLRR